MAFNPQVQFHPKDYILVRYCQPVRRFHPGSISGLPSPAPGLLVHSSVIRLRVFQFLSGRHTLRPHDIRSVRVGGDKFEKATPTLRQGRFGTRKPNGTGSAARVRTSERHLYTFVCSFSGSLGVSIQTPQTTHLFWLMTTILKVFQLLDVTHASPLLFKLPYLVFQTSSLCARVVSW